MKTLVVIATRNNPTLLISLIKSMEKFDAGFPYDLIIADNSSDDKKHLDLLATLSEKYNVIKCENDRAESTFEFISKQYIDTYDYFFFCHEDCLVYKDNWLKAFIDRTKSNFHEHVIDTAHIRQYQIGRVSSIHQPYKDCSGTPFLKACLEVLQKNILIFKYSDMERVLYTQDCLKTSGLFNLNYFKNLEKIDIILFRQLKEKLDKYLAYPDEGMGPKDKYPAGQSWCKFMLLSEFLNSIWPLLHNFRTVGLEGEGYAEDRDGYDIPWGQNYIIHYGSPNVKKYLAKCFNTTPELIHQKIYSNDGIFLLQASKKIMEHYT
jgi:hypothetical protein